MNFILGRAPELRTGRWKAPRTGSLERLPYKSAATGLAQMALPGLREAVW